MWMKSIYISTQEQTRANKTEIKFLNHYTLLSFPPKPSLMDISFHLIKPERTHHIFIQNILLNLALNMLLWLVRAFQDQFHVNV